MKEKRFTKNQGQAVMASYKNGNIIVETVCCTYQISTATFYEWKVDFAIQGNEEKKRLKELEKENARLKKMYVELQLKKSVLSETLNIAKTQLYRNI